MSFWNTIFKWLGVNEDMTLPTNDRLRFFELELDRWLHSLERQHMINGDKYYMGKHDILHRKRTAIAENGQLIEVNNLPNNKIVNNLYGKIVDQKCNYLLSKPILFESGNKNYDTLLKTLFNDDFLRRLKNSGIDAINGGITWIYPYYNENGEFCFQSFRSYEILPFWKDNEHTELDAALRYYHVEGWEGSQPVIIKKVEIFTADGIERYILEGNKLVQDVEEPFGYYARIGDKGFTWDKIPLIAFKSNGREIPLLNKCKALQDAYNTMLSNFANGMEEDCRNTILVIKNYDGENLGEFRRNLSTYGAIKVKTVDGADAGVDTLTIEVNKDNYESILQLLKKSIIENCMSYDAKDDRLGGNANQMNIKSMYSDIDIDADNMETEYKAGITQLLFFVNSYLATSGKGSYFDLPVKITFNRDTLINKTEVIESLVKLGVRLPNELLVAQVPFVDNVQDVMDMLEKEKEENDIYAQAFMNNGENANDNSSNFER